LGKITDTMLEVAALEFFKLYFSDSDEINPEAGDFYTLNPVSAMFEYTVPTDRESVMDYLSLCNVPLDEQNILEEIRTRELENEGMTRSDAQSVVDVEVRTGKLKVGL
jgi:hypothetical protein